MMSPPWDVYVRDVLICETCWIQWVDGEREIGGWPNLDNVSNELRGFAKQDILTKKEEYNPGYLEEMISEDTTTAY